VEARDLALDLTGLRTAGLAMLGLGVVLPLLPGNPGVPCPLRTLTGVPCPMCGMSTSVEAVLRLDLHGALAANPAGLLAVAVAIALLVVRPRQLRVPAFVVPLALTAMWLFELHRFSYL
jgi:hypothetical protein